MTMLRITAEPRATTGYLTLIETAAGAGNGTQSRIHEMTCALGRSGILEGKREGDGGTPAGSYPLRNLFYRPDRRSAPVSGFDPMPIQKDFGWGDDPSDPETYNRLALLPLTTGHEPMWRDDPLYDYVVVIGYNDAPPVPGRGSAIFMHLAREGYQPTEGCVALCESDMVALLARIGPETTIEILLPSDA